MNRLAGWSHPWVFYLAASFLFLAVFLRSLLIYRESTAIGRVLGFLFAWLVLAASEPAITRRQPGYFPVYLLFQTALVFALLTLPANPDGQAQLEAALYEAAAPPPAQPLPALPTTAQAVSGQTYVFEPNPLDLRSARLDFDAPAEATLQIDLAGEDGPRVSGVGLDGSYRPIRRARPVLARGQSVDEHTFVIDYNEGPGMDVFVLEFRYSFRIPIRRFSATVKRCS